MDSLTQIVLGGAVGERILGKKVGNKAILWGAIGGTIPDLDTIPGQFLDTVSRLEIHRGFSHSIVFALLVSPLLAWLIWRLYKRKESDWWGWTQLFFWTIFTHPLLDIFTTWGTQLFWPFNWRIAIQSVFVIDPFYTLPFLITLLVCLFLKRDALLRRRINKLGLVLSSVYLLLTLFVKYHVNNAVKDSLREQAIEYKHFETRPAPFSALLWTANIETEDNFYITYFSLFDEDNNLILFPIEKNHELLHPYRNNDKVERLIRLTKGYYSVEKQEHSIVINDLRFGLSKGFMPERGSFVFRYELKLENGKVLIDQLPNDLGELRSLLGPLYQRISGIKFL